MNDVARFPSEPPASEIDPLGLELPRPDDEFVFAYVNSMPLGYRRLFDEDAQHEHAAIAFRRGEKSIHVEIWRKFPERIVAIAAVADDKPGLLSRISAALVAHDMDIVAAQAYRAEAERRGTGSGRPGMDPPPAGRGRTRGPIRPLAGRRPHRRNTRGARASASHG